jgi:hypothetical protein
MGVQQPIVLPLMRPRLLRISMQPMDQPLSTHHVELHPAQMHLVQTRSFVAAVADETLVAGWGAETGEDDVGLVGVLVGDDAVEVGGRGGVEGRVVCA